MSKKFLGKVMAGVALGGASLLISTPGIALADDAKADHEKITEVCKVVKIKKDDFKKEFDKRDPKKPKDGNYGKKDDWDGKKDDWDGKKDDWDGKKGDWDGKQVIELTKECKLIIVKDDKEWKKEKDWPKGGAKAGDGDAGAGTNGALLAGGVGMLAAAAIGGTALMRRREATDPTA